MMRVFFTVFLTVLGLSALAAGANVSAGQVAGNTSDILETVTSIIVAVLYIAAMGVFISATMKYRIHRQNPQQIPLSTPITELILAIVLAALPTVSKMTNQHLFNVTPNLIQSQQTPHAPSGAIVPVQPGQPQQPYQPYQPQPSQVPGGYQPPAYSQPYQQQ